MRTKLLLITAIVLSVFAVVAQAQTHNVAEAAEPGGKTLVFRFVADNDMFYIPWQNNGDKLNELIATIDHYKSAIERGQAKINVAGYCSSYATAAENIKSAVIRANRVKSELIIRNGIKEEHFVTTVHTTPRDGFKSVVVVTLRVPQISEPAPTPAPKPTPKPEPKPELKPEPKPAVEVTPDPQPEPEAVVEPEPVVATIEPVLTKWDKEHYRFAVRTNLLYDAFLLPTLGIEWRVSKHLGIKFDGSFSWWGGTTGRVQKIFVLSPEVRYYMGAHKRFYAGVGANYASYNNYGYLIGSFYPKSKGYQGTLWSAGAVVGYQLPLGRALALDFNIGLGCVGLKYDSFEIFEDTRTYIDKDQRKTSFNVTQAGISLVWKIK